MAGTKNHVLVVPKAVFILRCFQLATAVAVMGLMAYGITFYSFDADNLMMFTAIATIIISIYMIVAETCAPVIYNYWAVLGLDIFALVFWLASFSYLASQVAGLRLVSYDYTCGYYSYYCYKKRDLDAVGLTKRATTDFYTYRNSLAAGSGLGGLEFIFFIITLIFTALALHRHRKAGGHCTPNSEATTATEHVETGHANAYAPSVATTAVEHKTELPQQAYQQQPQQTYQQQPQQAYQQQPMQAAQPMQQQPAQSGYGGQPAYA